MSARGERDVEAIVDQHARRRGARRGDDAADEPDEIAIVEVTLADLDGGDALLCGPRRALDEIVERPSEAHAIGDEVGDDGHAGGVVSPPRRDRDANSDPSSASPASAVITPTPLTPPRAYGLCSTCSRRGRVSTNRLRSQIADHGATARMNPASRKYAANNNRLKVRMISSRSGRGPGARSAPPHRDSRRSRPAAPGTPPARANSPPRARASIPARTTARTARWSRAPAPRPRARAIRSRAGCPPAGRRGGRASTPPRSAASARGTRHGAR